MIQWLKPDWPVQQSKCGRYCIVRATAGTEDNAPWFIAYRVQRPAMSRVVGEYRSDDAARSACESHAKARTAA